MTNRITGKHSITINGHRTSVTLEDYFWESLHDIAALQKKSIHALIEEIDQKEPANLSSAIRVFILKYYRTRTV